MNHLHFKNRQQLILLILILLSISCATAQYKKGQPNNIKERIKRTTNIDSLKIDLSISYRRDAGSYKYYSKLSPQDSVNYKIPADTLLGRVRMFKIIINQKASLGNYKSSFIKEIRLEYKYKDSILNIEHEKYFKPVQNITIWNGKENKRPKLLAEADQVVIVLITETDSQVKNSKYVVNL